MNQETIKKEIDQLLREAHFKDATSFEEVPTNVQIVQYILSKLSTYRQSIIEVAEGKKIPYKNQGRIETKEDEEYEIKRILFNQGIQTMIDIIKQDTSNE